MPEEKAADARALVGEQKETLPFGELWQPCRRRGCEEEPSCVSCEYCAEHCGCQQGQTGDTLTGHHLAGEPYGGEE